MTHSAVGEGHSVASRQNCVRGAQVWLRKKTENNKCISYHPEHHSILRSMRYCIRPVCHSHTIIKQETQLMLTNPRDAFRGQSRSPNIVPFHMLGIFLLCNSNCLYLFQIFDFKNVVTFKSRLKVTQGH